MSDGIRKKITDMNKQDKLVSGINIKTINNQSILGSGNIIIEGGEGGGTAITIDQNYRPDSENAQSGKAVAEAINDNTATNLKNGFAEGSLRTYGSKEEDSSYKLGENAVALGKDTIALANNSYVSGENSIAGSKAFIIQSLNEDTLTFTLDDVVGLSDAINNYYSCQMSNNYDYIGKIISVDNENNTVKVSAIPSGYTIEVDSVFWIPDHPELGTIPIGDAAFSTGTGNKSSHVASFTSGRDNVAGGKYSFATGRNNYTAYSAFASGRNNKALGQCSHVEGMGNQALGNKAHAEGGNTIASGENSHSSGQTTVASGRNSYSINYNTQAIGENSFASGDLTKAEGKTSHAEGVDTTAKGIYSHAEGGHTKAEGKTSHSEGYYTIAKGDYSHAEGDTTNALESSSHAEGHYTTAKGIYSHTEGDHTIAEGKASHSEGFYTTASGYCSHAEGQGTKASGNNSHTEGQGTKALGNASHAEGIDTTASGDYSHAEGYKTKASSGYSHAEGSGTTASGINSHAEGYSTIAGQMGFKVTACQKLTDTTGTYTLASVTGLSTGLSYSVHLSSSRKNCGQITAINTVNNKITVDGYPNIALNTSSSSTANYLTIVNRPDLGHSVFSGNNSHAEGQTTKALGNASHAEGVFTTASGYNSHAEGSYTTASGSNSHVEGGRTTASGYNSHAEGWFTEALGKYSHAEGLSTKASGNCSHAEGNMTIASSICQHVQGISNIIDFSNTYADIIGNGSSESIRSNAATVDWKGNAWYAGDVYVGSTSGKNKDEGSKKLATEDYVNSAISSSGGTGSNVQADWNQNDETANDYIKNRPGGYIDNDTIVKIPEIYLDIKNTNIVNGSEKGSLRTVGSTEESSEYTIGINAFAEGNGTKASGDCSHAEGDGTTASGHCSHAEGFDGTTASGDYSHAEGFTSTASGDCSHASGHCTNAGYYAQTVVGCFNENKAHTLFEVGNGPDHWNRSNAATVDWSGNAWYAGAVTSNAADYAEFFEWLDGNPDNEDRVGYLVALDGEKIRFANPGDEILGIISANPAILGDNYECDWNGKYLTDEFGRILYDKVEEFIDIPKVDEETGETTIEKKSLGFFDHPRINPDYDPEQEYINRRNRSEWAMVGMLGKLFVRDDGTAQINGYVSAGEGGIATASTEKTNMRVLSRVNDHVVKVLLK